MTPLERRCRRLLWLLPPDDRAARGEELVGLLCDVSGDRSRPHRAEVWSLVRMALRLRLRAARTLVVLVGTALLVAGSSQPLGTLIDTHTGAVLARDMGPVRDGLYTEFGASLLPLVVTVAWLVGAVRVALAVYSLLFAFMVVALAVTARDILNGSLLWDNVLPLLILTVSAVIVLVMLTAAWRWEWRPPRPPALWLVLLVLSVVVWKGVGEWGRHGVVFSLWLYEAVPVLGAVAGAAAGAWLARRHRPETAVVAAGAGGGVGAVLLGWTAMSNLLVTGIFQGSALPLALVLLVVAAPAHLIAQRLRPTPSGSFEPGHGGPSVAPGGR
jgi:hypothetical protein